MISPFSSSLFTALERSFPAIYSTASRSNHSFTTMMSLFSALTVAVFFFHQCLADNATTTTYGIFGINSNNASHAWDNVYGSVIAADKNAVTVHLDCRPGIPSPSPCGDQDATVTAGPSTWAYTSSSSTYYASMACSKTEKGGTFTCSWHNHLHDSMEVNTVSLSVTRS